MNNFSFGEKLIKNKKNNWFTVNLVYRWHTYRMSTWYKFSKSGFIFSDPKNPCIPSYKNTQKIVFKEKCMLQRVNSVRIFATHPFPRYMLNLAFCTYIMRRPGNDVSYVNSPRIRFELTRDICLLLRLRLSFQSHDYLHTNDDVTMKSINNKKWSRKNTERWIFFFVAGANACVHTKEE